MSIKRTQLIISPNSLRKELLITEEQKSNIQTWRNTISSIIHGKNKRLLVIVWPCSIHDTKAAIEYAQYIQKWREEFQDDLEIVMRTYFEKPRTTVWWKWLINDPYLDGSYAIEAWIRTARKLLLDIANMWIPTATEFLDPIAAIYLSDLISWGAIGARTTESQTHRELASGLPCPIGFKNGTDGSVKIAIDAIQSSSNPHTVLSGWEDGGIAIITTSGNPDTHVILRGSNKWINYDNNSIKEASDMAKKAWLPYRIMIDVSHQNSQKDYKKQIHGIHSIAEQIQQGEDSILGVMIESNIYDWSQSYIPGKDDIESLVYGKSITDACVDIFTTYQMLQKLSYIRQQN